jgi:26S proteasome regulatory subunit N7
VKEKIINNPEIIAVLREDQVIYDYVFSFYNSKYDQLFKSLLKLTEKFILEDKFLSSHKDYLLKTSKVAIFK